jgi:chemotaxis protein MotB
MARRKKAEEHANHERWLVSYADFITLLFALFVVMFAVSQVDYHKVGRFTESFAEALEWQVLHGEGGGLMKGRPTPAATSTAAKESGLPKAHESLGEKESIRKGLQKRAQTIPALAGLIILEAHGELVLRLPERLMFDVGEALIHEDGKKALEAISEELSKRDVRIRIEGHTDNAPIRTVRYPSNWELSTARGASVVAFMLGTGKLDPKRLAAAGYSEHHPIASNDTVEGRAQNRRVDIIVVTDLTPPQEIKR